MTYGIEHVGLMAEDPEALAAWYERVFGFRIVYKSQKTPPAVFLAPDSGSMIEIFPYKEGVRVLTGSEKEAVHLAIEVKDFDQALDDLGKKGVVFIGGPKESAGGVKVIFFKDPEANWGQLIYRPEPLK